MAGGAGASQSAPALVVGGNDDEEDELEDMLEFRFSNGGADGIMRTRDPSEDGIPQVVRMSTSTRPSVALSESDRRSVAGQGQQHGLFEQDPTKIGGGATTKDGHEAVDPTKPSEASHQSVLKSEFAHMDDKQMAGEKENAKPEDDEDDDDDAGWQDMKTVGSYDVYDDKGRVVVHRAGTEDVEESKEAGRTNVGTASKGYTRVAVDDDVKSINSMDENTNFLFDEEELNRDPVSQLQATKGLLTDSQRIAYVGLCRLMMIDMEKEGAQLRGSRRAMKSLSTGQDALAMWAQKMMLRLYAHMDLSSEEQIMIEQLGQHGVLPSDLSPSLKKGARVKNPLAEPAKSEKNKPDHDESSHGDDSHQNQKSGSDNVELKADENQNVDDMTVTRPDDIRNQETIDIDVRWTLLCDLFLVLISDSVYDSRSRTLLTRVGGELGVTPLEIAHFERKVTDALQIEEGSDQNWDESEIIENRRKLALRKKYMYVGLATLGGGLVIGLSAGLLAPVIGAGLAAGFTTIGVTGTGTFLAGAGGAAVVTSTGAAVGARIGSKGMSKRMGHVRTFEFRPLHNNKRVNCIVTVSGWMSSKEDDVRLPFSTVDPIMGDLLSVQWEPEMLTSMGQTINILATEVLTQSIQQVLGQTVLVALMSAVQLPMALSKLGYLLDNPWNVSLDRAWSAGLILADTLVNRHLGVRPVTLVGFSLGARVVYSCLVELSRRAAYGLVDNVYIFGSPLVVKQDQFSLARSVVSGRFVNGYSRKDWILGYLFRATSGGLGRVAGLAPITSIPHVENLDCTDYVEGHMGYRNAMPKLLKMCDWEVISEQFTEIDDPDPEQLREKQHALMEEFEEARKQMDAENARAESLAASERRKSKFFGWFKPKKKDWWDMAAPDHPSESADESSPAGAAVRDQAGEEVFNVEAIMKEVNTIARDKGPSASPSKLPGEVPVDTAKARAAEEAEVSMSFEPYEDDEAERNANTRPSHRHTEPPTPRHNRSSDELPRGGEQITMHFE